MAIDNKMIVKLATHICHHKTQGRKNSPIKIAGYELDPDGRTVKTVVRELRDGGYLTEYGEKGYRGTYYYYLTDLAWEQIEPTRPDLFKWFLQDMKDVRFKDHAPHIRWSRLSLSEQKYALSSIGEYIFAFGNVRVNDIEIYPFTPNQVEGKSGELMVGSLELTEQVKTWRREQNIERVYRTQLFEGLIHCGILPKDTPKFISVGKGSMFSPSDDCGQVSLSDEPEKWQEQLGDRLNDTLDKLQKLQTLLGNLLTVQSGVIQYGGWEKFLADYRQASVDAVDKVAKVAKETPDNEA